jgi:hypothetical protein
MAKFGDISPWCRHAEKKMIPANVWKIAFHAEILYRIITNMLWWGTGSSIRHTKTIKIQTVFYVVRTVHFGMKLYNDQCNAKVFN